MIIIKIVILYFTQITHTDDFPSTGTRLLQIKTAIGKMMIVTQYIPNSDSSDVDLRL